MRRSLLLQKRIKISRLTIFFKGYFLISNTQTLKGFTSKVVREKNLHYIFGDLDNCTQKEAEIVFTKVQYEFKLGDTYLVSDLEGSYRFWCFSKRPWTTYCHILIHILEKGILDYGFWVWTLRRGAATLRYSKKEGRPLQHVVSILKGYEETQIPEKMVHVVYDTGIEKKGTMVIIG
jgi:hypothetical protein